MSMLPGVGANQQGDDCPDVMETLPSRAVTPGDGNHVEARPGTRERAHRIDDILAAIDSGLQSTTEASYGENGHWGNSHAGDRSCVRCVGALDDDGDLCGRCRAFLLEDSPDDPAVYSFDFRLVFGESFLADMPVVQAPRGGIRYPPVPDLSAADPDEEEAQPPFTGYATVEGLETGDQRGDFVHRENLIRRIAENLDLGDVQLPAADYHWTASPPCMAFTALNDWLGAARRSARFALERWQERNHLENVVFQEDMGIDGDAPSGCTVWFDFTPVGVIHQVSEEADGSFTIEGFLAPEPETTGRLVDSFYWLADDVLSIRRANGFDLRDISPD